MDKIMTIHDALSEEIKVLNYDLKEEIELKEILKRRLTKKEWKYFLLKMEGVNVEDTCTQLDMKQERYDKMVVAVYKKLNSEKIKQELVVK
jgi:hypothetical protein